MGMVAGKRRIHHLTPEGDDDDGKEEEVMISFRLLHMQFASCCIKHSI